MNNSLPYFKQREKRIFIEERILDFSSALFHIPVMGLVESVVLNILFCRFYDKLECKFPSVLFSLTCFFFISIIIEQLISFKTNK